jgi:hypothetical protein
MTPDIPIGGQGRIWAIVLAGGAGRRLTALTTTSAGTVIPKQYCSLWGGSSLLQDALARARTVAAREHTCVVVAAGHNGWWEVPLWAQPVRNTIAQPVDRGTAIGVLLPLLHILGRDPAARILILPSDHRVREERILTQASPRSTAAPPPRGAPRRRSTGSCRRSIFRAISFAARKARCGRCRYQIAAGAISVAPPP